MEKNYNLTWHPISSKIVRAGMQIKLNNEDMRYRVIAYNSKKGIASVMPIRDSNGSFKYTATDYWASGSLETVTVDGFDFIKYDGSLVDTLLNTTYYNSLSSAIKSAIVPHFLTLKATYTINEAGSTPLVPPDANKIFTVKGLKASDPDYNNRISTYSNGVTYDVGLKNVYAPTVDIIRNYFQETQSINEVSIANLFNAFMGVAGSTISENFWLADPAIVYNNNTEAKWVSASGYGSIFKSIYNSETGAGNGYFGGGNGTDWYYQQVSGSTTTRYTKPMFDIDLNKVSWEVYSEN